MQTLLGSEEGDRSSRRGVRRKDSFTMLELLTAIKERLLSHRIDRRSPSTRSNPDMTARRSCNGLEQRGPYPSRSSPRTPTPSSNTYRGRRNLLFLVFRLRRGVPTRQRSDSGCNKDCPWGTIARDTLETFLLNLFAGKCRRCRPNTRRMTVRFASSVHCSSAASQRSLSTPVSRPSDPALQPLRVSARTEARYDGRPD